MYNINSNSSGVILIEFVREPYLRRQKTKVPRLSYGVVSVIVRSAVYDTGYDRQGDRQTDRQTHDDSIYRACIASLARKTLLAGHGFH